MKIKIRFILGIFASLILTWTIADLLLFGSAWRPTGSMNKPRSDFLTAVLPDGRVMALGGSGSEKSAEIFDPKTETWTNTGSPQEKPADVTVSDGKVYAFSTDVEEWSPESGTWKVIFKQDDPNNNKAILGIIPKPLSLVYETETSIEILDLKSGKCKEYPPLDFSNLCNGGTTIACSGGQLHIVAAGMEGTMAYYYDPKLDKWCSLPDLQLDTDYFNDVSSISGESEILYRVDGVSHHDHEVSVGFTVYSTKTGKGYDVASDDLKTAGSFLFCDDHLIALGVTQAAQPFQIAMSKYIGEDWNDWINGQLVKFSRVHPLIIIVLVSIFIPALRVSYLH